MADTTPLSDGERAELEQLRAEKAARADAARAAQERAELERLKEERAYAQREAEAIERESQMRERGRRIMEPDEESLGMPLGQKVVLGLVLLVAIVLVASRLMGA